MSLEDAIEYIECDYDEPRQPLGNDFWRYYERIKADKPQFRVSKSPQSIEIKALNNVQSAIRFYKDELGDLLPFAKKVVKDIRDYRSIPKYSLRRLCKEDITPESPDLLSDFLEELRNVKNIVGDNFLERLDNRVGKLESEVIIGIENRKV